VGCDPQADDRALGAAQLQRPTLPGSIPCLLARHGVPRPTRTSRQTHCYRARGRGQQVSMITVVRTHQPSAAPSASLVPVDDRSQSFASRALRLLCSPSCASVSEKVARITKERREPDDRVQGMFDSEARYRSQRIHTLCGARRPQSQPSRTSRSDRNASGNPCCSDTILCRARRPHRSVRGHRAAIEVIRAIHTAR
jgi:hypothetical protein